MNTATSSRSLNSALGRAAAPTTKPALLVVIYANPDYYPPTVNALSILRRYFSITVVCRNVDIPFREWGNIEVVRVGRYKSAPAKQQQSGAAKALEYFRFCTAVRRATVTLQPAAIYAYDNYGFIAAIRTRAAGTPVVFHQHELPDLRASSWRLEAWITRYALRLTRAADLVVQPEINRARIWSQAAADSRRPMLVPNCSSRDFYSAEGDVRAIARRRFEQRKVFYVGWMSRSNGHVEALRAVAQMALPATLVLVGPHDAALGRYLTCLSDALGVGTRLELHGWVPHSECSRRFAACAVGLSLYKPVGANWEFNCSATNKLFEYAAMGLPVVVPDRKSYREFLNSDSWVAFANPDDPASIARAIEFILADRERYVAMSLAARKAHEEKYNYETVFQPVLARLEQLAAGSDLK